MQGESKASAGQGVEGVVDKELEQAATSLQALDLTSSIQQSAQRHVRAAQDRAEALEEQLLRNRAAHDAQLLELRLSSQTLQAALEVLVSPPPGRLAVARRPPRLPPRLHDWRAFFGPCTSNAWCALCGGVPVRGRECGRGCKCGCGTK